MDSKGVPKSNKPSMAENSTVNVLSFQSRFSRLNWVATWENNGADMHETEVINCANQLSKRIDQPAVAQVFTDASTAHAYLNLNKTKYKIQDYLALIKSGSGLQVELMEHFSKLRAAEVAEEHLRDERLNFEAQNLELEELKDQLKGAKAQKVRQQFIHDTQSQFNDNNQNSSCFNNNNQQRSNAGNTNTNLLQSNIHINDCPQDGSIQNSEVWSGISDNQNRNQNRNQNQNQQNQNQDPFNNNGQVPPNVFNNNKNFINNDLSNQELKRHYVFRSMALGLMGRLNQRARY